ncbi:DUF2203 domain-containing protein [Humisphaera borealis]|uniref:DUF2203 domain-containing protein n=1 Tax=Humisphaera borealis TaxID=2807512 RepID=A0A7M2WVA9_9BACT|nr:DUF2203 domain-containing protein [Humisphaera borealis]QOV89162.1 DUF2203 domain-containing protein [Humisphaera borealis]
MRGPQSASPEYASSPRAKRRFTVAEANRALPLVSRVVADIVHTHTQAIFVQSQIGRATSKEQPALQNQLDKMLERLEDFVDELTEIGCDLKDYTLGLIDFTGTHMGRDVCLCWKLGEDKIDHWHEMDEGFPGRRPIHSLQEAR